MINAGKILPMTEQQIEKNKVVSITYSIRDDGGELLEQSDLPISYVHGIDKRMFEKIEHELEGHMVGDSIEVKLTPKEGFGERDPDLSFSDTIENVPAEYRQVGAEAMFQNEDGETITMTVVSVKDGKVTLDGNHPFAGKTVTFAVKVVEVRQASPEELQTGEAVVDISGSLH
ncbi:MAG: FKBP-type peptidyl-prolyl cis-trans isomerase [Gammaproteobacteria bacterium]|nr:FKBP-type peptidyl-prolyl cis-trans isomerase [Gammaproteobacteria bacterium]MDH5594679.1 FKBP-type peptidyl-prolyl cis-trans isomerase [Gammaproteobacteria bacterium]MDH5613628.1 FKBP-type peptidyl-prolyl cis-trans isomerase [Gammaproteobacteria bacterium]